MSILKLKFVWLRILFLVMTALTISGCSSYGGGESANPKDKNVALIFGYFDMEDAPSNISYVTIRQFKPRSEALYLTVDAEDGLFFHLGVDMGSYQVERFGKTRTFFNSTHYRYGFNGSGKNASARKVTKPGTHFLGAYKYLVLETSWGRTTKTDVKIIKSPTEKELLKRVLKKIKSDYPLYTHQIRWIKKRLAEI